MRTNTSKKRGVKEKILNLRQKGHSYDSIIKEADVSKGTVSYHCGVGQKEKTINRMMKRKEGICGKVHGFVYNSRKPYQAIVYKLGPIRKKARGFIHGPRKRTAGITYQMMKSKLKHPNQKVWAYIGKVFPGIKSEKDNVQAVNQWTGKPDYTDDGKPLAFPYMRCKISGDIYDSKGSDVQADHIDGDRLNNHISNFSFVHSVCNYMKGQMSYKQLYEKICKIKTNLERYKELWNG